VNEQQDTLAQKVRDAFNNQVDSVTDVLLIPLSRWLVQVAAIAVGTCLGITLFVVLAWDQVESKMQNVNFNPSTTTTTTPTWPQSP
jgi:hypothetical protein